MHETVSLAGSPHKNCSKMRSFVEYRLGHKTEGGRPPPAPEALTSTRDFKVESALRLITAERSIVKLFQSRNVAIVSAIHGRLGGACRFGAARREATKKGSTWCTCLRGGASSAPAASHRKAALPSGKSLKCCSAFAEVLGNGRPRCRGSDRALLDCLHLNRVACVRVRAQRASTS